MRKLKNKTAIQEKKRRKKLEKLTKKAEKAETLKDLKAIIKRICLLQMEGLPKTPSQGKSKNP